MKVVFKIKPHLHVESAYWREIQDLINRSVASINDGIPVPDIWGTYPMDKYLHFRSRVLSAQLRWEAILEKATENKEPAHLIQEYMQHINNCTDLLNIFPSFQIQI